MFSDSGREWKHFSFLSGLEWECFSFNNQANFGEGSSGIYSVQYNCSQESSEQEICCCSIAQSCLTLCNPMECSTPGFPALHYLPRVCSNACPLSWYCHPIISSSVVPFSSCLQSFSESGSFPIGWLFPSGDQSIGASASASVLPVNIQGWFPLDRLVWSPIHTHTQMSVESERNIRILENSGHPILTCQPCSF